MFSVTLKPQQGVCMLRLTFLALITLTFSCVTGAEKTEAEKLPPDAAKYVEQCENDIMKLRKTLVVNLGKSLTKATKAGDLDAANAVKAKIEETEKLTSDGKDLLGNKAPDHVLKSNTIPKSAALSLEEGMPSLGEANWNALGGVLYTVPASDAAFNTKITLGKDDQYLLVPHPTDVWGGQTWAGNTAQENWNGRSGNGGALMWTLTNDKMLSSSTLLVSGDGVLHLFANWGSNGGREGSLRVKVFKIIK